MLDIALGICKVARVGTSPDTPVDFSRIVLCGALDALGAVFAAFARVGAQVLAGAGVLEVPFFYAGRCSCRLWWLFVSGVCGGGGGGGASAGIA